MWCGAAVDWNCKRLGLSLKFSESEAHVTDKEFRCAKPEFPSKYSSEFADFRKGFHAIEVDGSIVDTFRFMTNYFTM